MRLRASAHLCRQKQSRLLPLVTRGSPRRLNNTQVPMLTTLSDRTPVQGVRDVSASPDCLKMEVLFFYPAYCPPLQKACRNDVTTDYANSRQPLRRRLARGL